jgi:hypothetical protein
MTIYSLTFDDLGPMIAQDRDDRIQAIRSKAGRYTRAALLTLRMASYRTLDDSGCDTLRRSAFRSLVRINATLAKLDAMTGPDVFLAVPMPIGSNQVEFQD